jgi:hypothetical protein
MMEAGAHDEAPARRYMMAVTTSAMDTQSLPTRRLSAAHQARELVVVEVRVASGLQAAVEMG